MLVVVAAVAALAAFLLSGRNHGPSGKLTTGRDVAVSRLHGPQSEVALTFDPVHPSVVLAGSNDIDARTMRVYQSTNGGSRWRTSSLPLPTGAKICGTSDPTVAVARSGRQYYGYLAEHCGRIRRTSLYVSTRASDTGAWTARPIPVAKGGHRVTLVDDRPMIVVDNGRDSPHPGRLYIAWTRFDLNVDTLWRDPDAQEVDFLDVVALISHSDDQGRHWSSPLTLAKYGRPLEVRLAIGNDGTVYATWRLFSAGGVYVAAAPDGEDFGPGTLVAAAVVEPQQSCHTARARIRAQPKRCVSPNPVIAVDNSDGKRSGRMYVVWGSTGQNFSQDVYVAAFDRGLRPLLGVGDLHKVNPPENTARPDQFLPTAAVDPSTGRLWACYYETVDTKRRLVRFTCTASDDGGETWLAPRAVATSPSDESRRPANVENGFGDYEAVAAANGRAVAAWTDGRRLRKFGEDIYANWIR